MATQWMNNGELLACFRPGWDAQREPYFRLLQETLLDLFAVRDCVRWYTARARKPPRRFGRQYERDVQWVSAGEDHVPFSFVWVCGHLGLAASAVQQVYLSGQPLLLAAAEVPERYEGKRLGGRRT